MRLNEFYDRLFNISESYRWTVDENNKVVATIQSGPFRGFRVNPLTALAHKSGFGLIEDTRDGAEFAAHLLGIPRRVARKLYSATLASNNHGNTQVLRGRIRSALEV
jgi:hypothetical protein